MGNFRELRVWQLAKEIAVEVYKVVDLNEKLKGDFRLKAQITSSAVSIPSNIAEGDELKTIKHGINHLYIAKGSCAELITQLIIAKEIKMIKENTADQLIDKCNHVSLMLYKLIQARKEFEQ